MRSCIVWGNSAAQGNQIYLEQLSAPTISYCTVEEGLSGIHNGLGVAPIFISLSDANPLFHSLEDGDYRLPSGSRAVDNGDPAFVADMNEGDLEHYPRVEGGRVDRGCYELWPGLALSLVYPGRAGELNSIDISGGRPSTPAAVFCGTDSSFFDLSFGACPDLHLGVADAMLLAVGVTSPGGRMSYSAPTPPALGGTDVWLQAVTFDPSSPGLGCAVSNLVHFTYP